MQGCGQHPDCQTYAILLDGLRKNLHFQKATVLFHEMEDKKLDLHIVSYSILIDGMCNAGKLTARELFNTLPTKGLQPNVRTYTIMIKGFCKEGLLNEARELFEKMEENDCSPDHFTYNTIIQGFLQHNEISWAVKYLQMMVENGFSANATIAIDLLSTNQADKTLQDFFSNICVKAF
jgi:pentatricopeptide repeat protein